MSQTPFHKILVVDDDPVQIKFLERLLTEEGYEVTSSSDASKGLEMALGKDPDLVLLDVMMPVINGFNFCKLIKSEEKTKNIPIIMITSRTDLEDIKIGMEMGADAYLCKPISTETLLKTIKSIQANHQ